MNELIISILMAATPFVLNEFCNKKKSRIYYQRVLEKFGVNNSEQPFLKLFLLSLIWTYIGAYLLTIPLCLHTIFFGEMNFGDLSNWKVALLFLSAVIPLLVWIKKNFMVLSKKEWVISLFSQISILSIYISKINITSQKICYYFKIPS